MDVYGPPQDGGSLHDIIDRVVKPPFFPVQVKELHGKIEFHEVTDDVVAVGSAKVLVRQVPHVGTTLGFRIEAGGRALAFVSDHQAPDDRADGGRGRARAVRRGRPGHPRRAVHRGGVTGPSRRGATRRSATPSTWPPRPGPGSWRCSTTTPGTPTTTSTACSAEAQATATPAVSTACSAAKEGLTIDLGRP